MATTTVKIVDTDGGAGHDYDSIALWEAGQAKNCVTADVIEVAKCRCTSGSADTSNCTISGSWNTDNTRYIKIWTDPSELYRHDGKWNTAKYRMEPAANNVINSTAVDVCIRLIGLQVKAPASKNGINCYSTSKTSYIEQCIITGATSSSGLATPAGTWKIGNTIVYGMSGAYGMELKGTVYVYNCTAVGCYYGFYRNGATATIKNCIAVDCTDGYNGTFGTSATNLSDINGDAPSEVAYGDPTFADLANKDFHLGASDTKATALGSDLSGDASYPISVDIDGETRTGTWDIGADQHTATAAATRKPHVQTVG